MQNTQTIYYTAGANAYHPSCSEHPEWAGLPCQTQPASQPKGPLPPLQVSNYTYNVWDEPENMKLTNTSGSSTRTTTTSYDEAGRPVTTTVSSTVGTALPTVTYAYNQETGALEKQSTTTEGKTKALTSVVQLPRELTSYTDADGKHRDLRIRHRRAPTKTTTARAHRPTPTKSDDRRSRRSWSTPPQVHSQPATTLKATC